MASNKTRKTKGKRWKNIEAIKAYEKILDCKIRDYKDNKELKKYIDKMLKIFCNENEYDFFTK